MVINTYYDLVITSCYLLLLLFNFYLFKESTSCYRDPSVKNTFHFHHSRSKY